MSGSADVPLVQLEECVRRKVRLSFARSGGRGGQNVNKVSTKVLARVGIGELDALSEEQRERVRARLKSRISGRGELAVFADRERSQARNRELAIARLTSMIAVAARQRRPRVKTRPSRRSVEKRLASKRRRGESKGQRRRPDPD